METEHLVAVCIISVFIWAVIGGSLGDGLELKEYKAPYLMGFAWPLWLPFIVLWKFPRAVARFLTKILPSASVLFASDLQRLMREARDEV